MENKKDRRSGYDDRVGVIPKTYKLKKTIVDDFKSACGKAGIAQSAQITKMMLDFIKKINS